MEKKCLPAVPATGHENCGKAVFLLGSPRQNGSTAAVLEAVAQVLGEHGAEVEWLHLPSLRIGFCRGCKTCHRTGECVQHDDVAEIFRSLGSARLVICASPSYWGDVTGQMKAFIDRCTPYSNTNPSRPFSISGAVGAAVAVRTGTNPRENLRLVETLEHFLGHLEIPLAAYFTVEGISDPVDLEARPEVLEGARRFGEELWQRMAPCAKEFSENA